MGKSKMKTIFDFPILRAVERTKEKNQKNMTAARPKSRHHINHIVLDPGTSLRTRFGSGTATVRI